MKSAQAAALGVDIGEAASGGQCPSSGVGRGLLGSQRKTDKSETPAMGHSSQASKPRSMELRRDRREEAEEEEEKNPTSDRCQEAPREGCLVASRDSTLRGPTTTLQVHISRPPRPASAVLLKKCAPSHGLAE